MEGLSISGRLVLKFGKNKVTGNFEREDENEMQNVREERGREKMGEAERSLREKQGGRQGSGTGSDSGASDHNTLAEGKVDPGAVSYHQPKG